MNVFVLCTGRCGSMTFARACDHIENFSSGHETRRGEIVRRIGDYPNNHIEVDNSLSWLLGRIEEVYGDDAFYVHLKRNREDTVKSFARRPGRVPKAYGRLLGVSAEDVDVEDIHRHYYETVNTNIEAFLRDKTHYMEFCLETAENNFRMFWEHIGATGDIESALGEWGRKYNASDSDEAYSSSTEKSSFSFIPRAFRKMQRIAYKLPGFLRDA